MGVHVMLDEKARSLGDDAVQGRQAGRYMIGRIQAFAHVVQQGSQQEFLIIGPLLAREFKYLQRVKQRVSLGMILRGLTHVFQRQEEHPVELIRIDLAILGRITVQIDSGIFLQQQLLQLTYGGALDGLARHGAFEDVMRLVLGVNRELEIESIVNVNVSEDPRLLVLDDLFSLHVKLVSFIFQNVGDQADAVGKDVNIDVGSFAHVSGHNAADEPGPKRPEQTHEAQGVKPHIAEILNSAVAFMDAGEMLDLFADFGVGGEVFGFDAFAAQLLG